MISPLTDTLVEDEPSEDPGRGRWAWLICIGSPEDKFATSGRVIPLDGANTVVFCRDESSDGLSVSEEGSRVRVGIPFGWVSGQHAELRVTETASGLQFSLRDLGSRNGTLVNGERLHEVVRLRPADVFEVGRSFWTVREVGLRKLRSHKLSELDPTGTCSPHLHHIHRTLHRLARSSIPIVLRGETGTGKQYLARAIHQVSGRRGPFVMANLGALSEDRVEQVLFGGAGGGSGLFEEANDGTLMLDELGELSPAVQGKLLSALTEGRAARVGEHDPRSFDVRLVCATLHDLSRMVDTGRFRPDLYSRLAGFVAELPPLRARREDMGLLTRAAIRTLQREGRQIRITSNAFRRMLMRAWPFNIRQLRQTLATASLLSSGDGTITADALAEILDQDDGLPENPDDVRRLRAELVQRLAEHQGDTDAVARAMSRDPYQIHRWLQRFDLHPETFTLDGE
ncbi:sigma-54-dependent Fis family transcriptional regulator [Paraliomyxa miuraensis]|uniref:sigma-54-dependent Fis family transcriptional regulator n=1 Tax=Paraliomyxa miuraensis TaxID=376150 RepID=UPI0022549249|nr:sigma 54-interacting transcriptional regulator [Paraliomyxa miuraensis]MCX4245705.1 sigma 54-interacting transcriptional regulator [Paraliomyxa miuraensis]